MSHELRTPLSAILGFAQLIESGTPPKKMQGIRAQLTNMGLPPYDSLNPGLMDYLATCGARAGSGR